MALDTETLARIFPNVPPDTLERILNQANSPNIAYVARVLNAAADKGKGGVPKKDYYEVAAEAIIEDDEDFPALTSKADVLRGLEADQEAKKQGWEQKARNAVASGDLENVVQTHNRVDQIATDALLNPGSTSIPKGVEKAMQVTGRGVFLLIDDVAEQGDRDAMMQAQSTVSNIQQEELRERAVQAVHNRLALMDNTGSEFEQAKADLTDEENTPPEVREKLDEIERGEYDVTYEQSLELAKAAKEWFEEYAEVLEANREDGTVPEAESS